MAVANGVTRPGRRLRIIVTTTNRFICAGTAKGGT
jgi:hypothetical protein